MFYWRINTRCRGGAEVRKWHCKNNMGPDSGKYWKKLTLKLILIFKYVVENLLTKKNKPQKN